MNTRVIKKLREFERRREVVNKLKPVLSIDGDMYCLLHGENPQEGIAGFGHTPLEAVQNFVGNFLDSLEGGDTSNDE